jgi:hypothetical protein
LFLARLLSFSRLPAEERRLALRALTWLVAVRIGLAVLAFTRVRSLTEGSLRRDIAPRDEWPAMVRRAVMRASRSLPGTTCLAQSLVAERLLRAAGHAAQLSIGVAPEVIDGTKPGVARPGRTSLDAHAWVESGGMLVTGDDPRGRYHILATFGAE